MPFIFPLAYLPLPSLDVRRTVRVYLNTLLYGPECSDVSSFTRKLEAMAVRILGLESMQEGTVVLVVRTKKESREVKRVVDEMEERWKAKFAIELEI